MHRISCFGLVFLSVLVGLCGLVRVWPQFVSVPLFRYQYCDDVKLKWTPVPLPDKSVSTTEHKKVSALGYQFELPWDDLLEEKAVEVPRFGGIHGFAFRSGNELSLTVNEQKAQIEPLRKGLGDGFYRSDYDFRRAMLEVTPQDLTMLARLDVVRRNESLLLMKGIYGPSDPHVLEIQTGTFRGFQYRADPQLSFTCVDELYSQDEDVTLRFRQKGPGIAPMLTQAEINRVLQSIHKVAEPTRAVSAKKQP